MAWSGKMWVPLGVIGALVVAACGGSAGGGTGGAATGGGGSSSSATSASSSSSGASSSASSSGGGASSSSSTSSSSSGSGGAAGEGFDVVANGTPKSMPYVSFSSAGPKTGVFTTSAGANPQMTMVIDDVVAVGDHPCGPVTQIGYSEYMGAMATTWDSKQSGASCLITLTQVPTQQGERWMGTFTATLLKQGGGTMELTSGTINIKY